MWANGRGSARCWFGPTNFAPILHQFAGVWPSKFPISSLPRVILFWSPPPASNRGGRSQAKAQVSSRPGGLLVLAPRPRPLLIPVCLPACEGGYFFCPRGTLYVCVLEPCLSSYIFILGPIETPEAGQQPAASLLAVTQLVRLTMWQSQPSFSCWAKMAELAGSGARNMPRCAKFQRLTARFRV